MNAAFFPFLLGNSLPLTKDYGLELPVVLSCIKFTVMAGSCEVQVFCLHSTSANSHGYPMHVAKTWDLDTAATLILDPELLLMTLCLPSCLALSCSSSLCSDLQGIPRSQIYMCVADEDLDPSSWARGSCFLAARRGDAHPLTPTPFLLRNLTFPWFHFFPQLA